MPKETKVELVTQPNTGSPTTKDDVLQKLLLMAQEEATLALATQIDEDGFVIPNGKLPIDGHFSTEEVKGLIELAQEDGAISNVRVDVIESGELGDRIEIVENHEKAD